MLLLPLFMALFAAAADEPFTSPTDTTPEYGHGLTAARASDGWISLFDGRTTLGWTDAVVHEGTLSGGESTIPFAHYELSGVVATSGDLVLGGETIRVEPGRLHRTVRTEQPLPIRLGPGIKVESLVLRPLGLESTVDGNELGNWHVIPHPQLATERQTRWRVEEGAIYAVGGPGALELDGRYGDLVMQLEVRTRAPLVNGGVFFRAIPGDFLNGYEAQIFNGCYGHDPARPAPYCTGALDDRQGAPRLVSRDEQPFTMTIVATGPHIATWVNGCQMVDWTDTRQPRENPREGRRVEPGAIQLQAHDSATDMEFRNIRIGDIGSP